MEIALGEFWQETNSFSPQITDNNDFDIIYRDDILPAFSNTGSEIGGMIDTLNSMELDISLIPIISARAVPSGPVADEVFEDVVDTFIDAISREEPDGVLLSFHGAMVTETRTDPEGEFLEQIREISEDITVVTSLDHHANVTKRMIGHSDGLVAYREHPHTSEDVHATGKRAANLLIKVILGEIDPVISLVKAPMITTTRLETNRHPMNQIFKLRAEIEEHEPDVVSVSACPVQPWLDAPGMGFAALVITDGDPSSGDVLAERLARKAWSVRDKFTEKLPTAQKAIEQINETSNGTWVVSDRGDCILGGAPGDSTKLLEKLLDHGGVGDLSACVPIVDPVGIQSIDTNSKEIQSIEVGGKITPEFTPMKITGTVEFVSDQPFCLEGDYYSGNEIDMGRRVTIKLSNHDVWLILTGKAAITTDPSFFSDHGVPPEQMDILVVKSIATFRPGFEPIADNIVILDTPGVCSLDMESFDYRLARPIFPLDNVTPAFETLS